MNKCAKVLSVIVIVIGLLLVVTPGVIHAASANDPYVVVLSGDTDFTTAAVEPANLPGTQKDSSGLIVPAGIPADEMQFGGNALVVSNFLYGKANACFPFTNYAYGWRGNVYQWSGSKWAKLDTVVTKGIDGSPALACATIYGSGTYALLDWYSSQDAPQAAAMKECTNTPFVLAEIDYNAQEKYLVFLGGIIDTVLPVGTPVSYQIFNISPAGSVTGDLSGKGSVFGIYPWGADGTVSLAVFGEPDIHFKGKFDTLKFTVRFTYSGCYKDYRFLGSEGG